MSPDRWKQIQDVFHAVLERDPRERSAAIAELCPDDPELREEVESLLSSNDTAGPFLGKPAFDAKAVATEISGETGTGERTASLAGAVIEHYQVISLLGAGGMGEVYRARDQRLGREVALKILCDTGPGSENLVRRFEYEVRAVAAFNHPNICHLYDVGYWNGRPFFTMELLDGRTLRDHVGGCPLPVTELVSFGIQIASALDAAHAKGIVHRDIKPANIFVTSQGPLKVMDFGLAKRAPDTASHQLTWSGARTLTGAAMGTVAWMSPEQARALDLDARTDLFSFGVVLYEMATGVQPFRGSTPAVVFDAILNQIPEPPSRLNPEISPELDRIILTALEKDREIRFQSAAEMRAALKRVQRSFETPSTAQFYAPGVVTPAPSPAPVLEPPRLEPLSSSWTRFPRRMVWAALTLLALAAGFAWWQFATPSDSFFHAPQFTKITTSGNATAAAISPDGHYVAYALDEAGKYSLWVRQVSIANGVRILPESPSYFRGLTFSRDGAYIYYVTYDNNLITRGSLYRVPTLGGTPTKVADEVSGAVSLSPDNRREAFLRSDFKTGVDELIVGEVDGTRQTRVASRRYPQHFAYSSAPAWSPDGQMIAVASEKTDKLGFYISVVGVRLKDHAEKILSKRRWQYVEQMSWLPGGRGILLVGKDQEASFQQIWHITSPDDEPRRLTNDLNSYYGISISADSQALVSAQAQTLTSVWQMSRYGASRRITPGYGRYFDLSLTPTGAIAYASDASGNADIWAMNPDGGQQRQLTSNAHRNYSPSVSPDGKRIAFHSNRTGTWNIWTMNIDGGDLRQLTSDANDSNWPVWTPDQKFLVYHHIGSAGYQTIWKIPSDGGTPVQVTDHFSLRPAVSPKDGTIACWYAEQPANPKWVLAILPPNGGPPLKTFPIPSTTSVDSTLRWTPDGKGITYADVRGGVSNIWVQTIDGAPPRQITNFNSEQIFSFDWSKSGELIYSRGVRTDDIVLITDAR